MANEQGGGDWFCRGDAQSPLRAPTRSPESLIAGEESNKRLWTPAVAGVAVGALASRLTDCGRDDRGIDCERDDARGRHSVRLENKEA